MAIAFNYAKQALGRNTVSTALSISPKLEGTIMGVLKDMGQRRAINLTHRYTDAAISLALYTGDGIVTKITPWDYFDHDPPVFTLPPVTSEVVKTFDRDFMITTYPWIAPGVVERTDIEVMRHMISDLGLRFCDNDDRADNIHRMPDQFGTLVGIDSSMLQGARNERHEELKEHWQCYLEAIFPKLYKEKDIPVQSEDTNFAFFSAHDRESGVIGFNHKIPDPILLKPMEEEQKLEKRSFWDKITGKSRKISEEIAPQGYEV